MKKQKTNNSIFNKKNENCYIIFDTMKKNSKTQKNTFSFI